MFQQQLYTVVSHLKGGNYKRETRILHRTFNSKQSNNYQWCTSEVTLCIWIFKEQYAQDNMITMQGYKHGNDLCGVTVPIITNVYN